VRSRRSTEMRALRRRPVRFRSADHGTTYGVVRRDARPVPRRGYGARGNAVRRIGIRVGMSVGRVSVVRCIGPILCPSSRAWGQVAYEKLIRPGVLLVGTVRRDALPALAELSR
jgi:hypothetical protein